jgi:hypothetical protein
LGDLISVNSQLPDHIRAAFGTTGNSDLTAGVSMGYPIVSYKGKTWQAVILKANPNLNKVYYEEGYEEGSTERPICHSNDAIAPAADAQKPQSPKCATCKWNQFGSKISDNGARGKACQDSRRLAIAPAGDLERAMLLRVPPASLKALLAYAQGLEKRGVPYAALVTKLGFDHQVAYPSLTFKAESWLSAEDVATVKEMVDSDLVRNICALDAVGYAEVAEQPEQSDDFLPPGGPASATEKKTTTKAKATKEEVAAAVQPTEKKTATGFGGGAKAAPQEPVETEASSNADVVAEGAMAELDAALEGFDD